METGCLERGSVHVLVQVWWLKQQQFVCQNLFHCIARCAYFSKYTLPVFWSSFWLHPLGSGEDGRGEDLLIAGAGVSGDRGDTGDSPLCGPGGTLVLLEKMSCNCVFGRISNTTEAPAVFNVFTTCVWDSPCKDFPFTARISSPKLNDFAGIILFHHHQPLPLGPPLTCSSFLDPRDDHAYPMLLSTPYAEV